MQDWKTIRADYIRGGITYKALAEKYGVSFSAVKRQARIEKWTDLRIKCEQKTNHKIINSVAKSEAKRVDKFKQISDILLKQIMDGIKSGEISISNGRSMRDITGALKDLKEIIGKKSQLDIDEQKARIDKLRKEATIEEQNNDIHIVIDGGENYSK